MTTREHLYQNEWIAAILTNLGRHGEDWAGRLNNGHVLIGRWDAPSVQIEWLWPTTGLRYSAEFIVQSVEMVPGLWQENLRINVGAAWYVWIDEDRVRRWGMGQWPTTSI